MLLKAVNETLELETSSTANIDYDVVFADHTSTTFVPDSSRGTVSAAGTATIVAAPTAGIQRQIKSVTVRNRHPSLANRVAIKIDQGGTEFLKTPTLSLSSGEMLQYEYGVGWSVLDKNGNPRLPSTGGFNGFVKEIFKVGTAKEAAGIMYSSSKDSGLPGAWSPGTPGLSGRIVDGTQAADVGLVGFPDPALGSMYLTDITAFSGVIENVIFYDTLWVNTGLVVTTTTAQTINSVAFPPRDLNGTINGEGCVVGILVTAGTTNAAAIANITMSYTNSSGVAGRTATMNSFPATAALGSLVLFQLQAGDTGVQSIQSVTLGTSLVTGAVSLVVLSRVADCAITVSSISTQRSFGNPGIKLFNRTAIMVVTIPGTITASNISASLTLQER